MTTTAPQPGRRSPSRRNTEPNLIIFYEEDIQEGVERVCYGDCQFIVKPSKWEGGSVHAWARFFEADYMRSKARALTLGFQWKLTFQNLCSLGSTQGSKKDGVFWVDLPDTTLRNKENLAHPLMMKNAEKVNSRGFWRKLSELSFKQPESTILLAKSRSIQ
ncbi:ImmA/IrrE family metallo-endopeptidase [Sesbania bispinosa]|nr:ImmA/IrrE family metallo-endopeptidase [Sesbania bispinosa]